MVQLSALSGKLAGAEIPVGISVGWGVQCDLQRFLSEQHPEKSADQL